MNGNSYWAWIIDEDVAHSPTLMAGHETRETAAASYAAMIIEDNGGEVLTGAVRVWDHEGSRDDQTVYDFTATLSPYEGDDDDGEFEVALELLERD